MFAGPIENDLTPMLIWAWGTSNSPFATRIADGLVQSIQTLAALSSCLGRYSDTIDNSVH